MKYWYFTFETSHGNIGSRIFQNEYFSFRKASDIVHNDQECSNVLITFFSEITEETYKEMLK